MTNDDGQITNDTFRDRSRPEAVNGHKVRDIVAYIWMLCSALSFATMGALTHALRKDASWEVIALARSIVLLILSGGIVSAAGVKLRFWSPWQLWARSIAGSVSMLFVFYSLTRLPTALVFTLMNLAPAWVAIASWYMLPKTRSKSVWVAVAVGIVGVILLQKPQLAQGNHAIFAPLIASLLLAVVMMALHEVRNVDSRVVVLHFAITAFVTSLAVFLFAATRAPLDLPTEGTTTFLLLATGIAATLGQLFLTVAFAKGPPAKVSVVGLTQVGFALFYDVAIWGHKFGILSFLGMLLVVAPTGWLLYVERRHWVEE